MKNRKKFSAAQQGFSLIEVLVVMTILAVIFGMVVRNVTGGQDKAKQKQAQIMVQKLTQAVQEFSLDTGNLPDSLDQLVNDSGDSMWMGPYVKEKELKDPWGESYHYSTQSQHGQSFDVYSYGKDKSPGGDKLGLDIGNWQ
ncbi:type II secretion system major pseudopilin GspG [Marinicella rhabdoformis]|uniref:type II secretion system major pseudopilin GspG n=1 Tax=Marinicella rhabdoformis TaxID=2580566 RepID=UPI0012AEB9DE|nr:type II secretion system major pseudopilin GspG [Marinicella rhabdoformis]